MFCRTCGAEMPEHARVCTQCGNDPAQQPAQENENVYEVHVPRERTGKSRIVAGILQLLLGFLGAGRLYMGYFGIGILQFILTVLTNGLFVLWPVIDGVLILCGRVKKDAYGIPLRN